MSGQPPSSSSVPLRPQPFRFWLPYRSNLAPPRPTPASPRPQPAGAPPPTPAEPAPRASPAPGGGVEDIPVQAESSSDESDTIPVQALESLRSRGARPSADLELTLSRRPPPSAAGGAQQSSSRDEGNDDAKISISGFPRAGLFDGARAPYRRQIEDGIKSLAGREAPAPRPDQGYRVITLAGHNVGASMVLGGGAGPRDAPLPRAAEPEGAARPPAAVAANVNSNVQSVNNSAMEGSTCNAGDPGVHLDVKNAHEEPVVVTPKREEEKEKPEEPARRTPPAVPPQPPQSAAASGDEAARQPRRTRRCLRAHMMESEATRKARLRPCRFQCVADHAPPATASNGSDGNALEGGERKESTM